MPYPSKIDRSDIVQAAVEQLRKVGLSRLSLRAVATALGVAPNAIYRYIPSREGLLAALGDEACRRLLEEIRIAGEDRAAAEAFRKAASAYLNFARREPALYEAMMSGSRSPDPDLVAHLDLWSAVVALATPLVGAEKAPDAAVSMWAFLHGIAALEAAGLLDERKPRSGLQFGLDAFLSGIRQ